MYFIISTPTPLLTPPKAPTNSSQLHNLVFLINHRIHGYCLQAQGYRPIGWSMDEPCEGGHTPQEVQLSVPGNL